MIATFEAVRKACSPQLWSRGIELVRSDAVVGERAESDEVAVRVATKRGMIARTVRLFLEDAQWECTCGAAICEHAAAAVIALKRAHDEGRELPSQALSVGAIAYRFSRGPGGLAIERGIRVGDAFHPFEATLAALSSGRVPAPPFTARQDDLAAELALGTHRRGPVPRAIVTKLLRALSACEDVSLGASAVRTATTPVGPRVAVEDQGDGFRVVLEDDPAISEVFQNGIALCGGILRPVAEPRLTGREHHEFAAGRHYGPSSWNELVTEVLPALRGRVTVDVRTTRLPAIERLPPRIVVETRRDGPSLTALAVLVYGDPPQARIDGGKLVHLQGALPLRDDRAEQREIRHLASRLGLAPGVPAVVSGADAVALVAKLSAWDGEVRGEGRERFVLAGPIAPTVRISDEGGLDVLFASEGLKGGAPRRADPGAVLSAFRAGESLVALDGGGYAPLPIDWLSRFGERIADLLAARDESGSIPKALLPDVARLCEDLDRPPPRRAGRLGGAHFRIRRSAGARPPRGFDRDAAPVPAARGRVAFVSSRRRLGRPPGGRHGTWENGSSPLRRARQDARRRPDERGAQLVGRDPALPAGAVGLRLPRGETRARPRSGRHDHQLRAVAAR